MTHFLENEAKGTNIIGATSLQDMVNKLKKPRKIMMLVKGEREERDVGWFVQVAQHSSLDQSKVICRLTKTKPQHQRIRTVGRIGNVRIRD